MALLDLLGATLDNGRCSGDLGKGGPTCSPPGSCTEAVPRSDLAETVLSSRLKERCDSKQAWKSGRIPH